ncbi:hypothetical protein COCOBI_12-2120 [Coccomyxa sp. Obi]|nr:hypothetical protein COCOBI_12-2120 [Coccomyxa sp. Obi]
MKPRHGVGMEEDSVIAELTQMFPDIANQQDVMEALQQDRAAAMAAKGNSAAQSFPFLTRMWARMWSLLLLIAIAWSLPVSLALVAGNIAYEWVYLLRKGEGIEIKRRLETVLGRAPPAMRGTAIVSGAKSTKGLHMCRHLHRAGWRVVLVDVHKNWAAGARWSGCVAAFRTYPLPNVDPIGYLKAIEIIAAEEDAKLFVPVSIAQYSLYEALAAQRLREKMGIRYCTADAQTVAALNDKIKFTHLCQRIGSKVPKMFPITSPQQLMDQNSRPEEFGGRKYLLKSIHYAATHRSDMFTLPCDPKVLKAYIANTEISEHKPWMLQQLLRGREYSSYSVAHEGQLVMHSDNEASLSCLDYSHINSKQIWDWVKDFCKKTKASGQLCFDFMKDDTDGQLYAFECNPRCSTILLNFYNHYHVAEAFFNPQAVIDYGKAPFVPHSSARRVIWIWNEVAELFFKHLPQSRSLVDVARILRIWTHEMADSTDALLDPCDPLPFLGLHYMQVPALLLRNLWRGNPWQKVDLCTGKLVELGGD